MTTDASHCSLISTAHVTEFEENFLPISFGHFGPKKPESTSKSNSVGLSSIAELILCVFTEDSTTVFVVSALDDKSANIPCSFGGDENAGFHTDFVSELTFSWSSTLETDFDLFSCFSFFFFFFFFLLLCFLCFFDFFFDESLFTSSSEVNSADFNSFDALSVSRAIVTGFASSRFSVFIVSS